MRRKLVDTTYLEGSIPSTSKPPIEVDEGMHCIPAGEIAGLPEGTRNFVVIGAGTTALDTCGNNAARGTVQFLSQSIKLAYGEKTGWIRVTPDG